MSLIHDALRKAAEEKKGPDGRPASWRDVEPLPARRRSSWPWVVLLVVAVAGILWLVFSGNPGNPARTETAVAAGTAGEGEGTKGTSGTSEKAAEVKVALAPEKPALPVPVPVQVSVPVPVSVSQDPPPATRPENTTQTPEVPFVPSPPPPQPQPQEDAPKLITPPARTGQVAQDTFVLEAQIDDRRFQLDFIVWSDSPFAQINGTQVGVGQQVDGFVVTAIERDQVVLESPTRRFVIRIR